jgi:15-cis-phytoene synthase
VIRVSDVASRLTKKSRSNFYYAFLALPRARRQALYAVYAFCRTVDDIADQDGAPDVATRRHQLDEWRAEIARCYEAGGEPRHPIARRLGSAVRAYPIPRDALEAIVDGVQMDIDGRAYETEDELYPYCYRVASAVGLCCIEIFGATDPSARPYAVNLGVALQLTNIIRDVGADSRAGRVYLPREDLSKFGVTVEDLRGGVVSPQFARLMEHEAERARRYYRAARESYPVKDARALVPAEIMGQIYRALLDEIERCGFRVFGERITVPTRRKVAIALRCWAAARLGSRRGIEGRAA